MTTSNHPDSTHSSERREGGGQTLQAMLQDSQRREEEVSALLAGSRAVLEYREFQDAARAIFDSCKQLIGATSGYIALLSTDGAENEVLFLDSGGFPCTVDASLPMPIRGLRERVYQSRKAAFDNSFANSQWMEFLPEGHVRLNNVLFAPLVIDGAVVGLLGIANKASDFTRQDARMASAFGELAAIALRNSRTLEALEGSEQRFRSLTQSASDGIVSTDHTGRIVYWNEAAEKMFGHSSESIVGKPLTAVIPERFRERHEQEMRRVVVGSGASVIGKTVEVVGLRADGSEFPIELSISIWNNKEGTFFTAILREISERKRAESLRHQLNRALGERVKELGCLYSLSKLAAKPSASIEDILQESVERLPRAWQFPELTCARVVLDGSEFATPNLRRTVWMQSADIRVSGKISGRVEVYCLDEIQEVEGSPFLEEEERLLEAIAEHLGRVIESRRAEEALRKAKEELEIKVRERTSQLSRKEESLSQAQRIAHLGNWDWNIKTNKLLWSDEAYRIFGFEPQAFTATYESFLECVHPDDRQHVKQAVNRALCSPNMHYAIDHRVVLPDGRERIVRESGEVMCNGDGEPVRMIGTVHDVTERRRLEREILTIGSEEQRRIAQELHDGLGQELTGLGYLAKLLHGQLQDRDMPEARIVAGIADGIQHSQDEVHRIVKGLLPPGIDAKHLAPALRVLMEHVQELTGVFCQLVNGSPLQLKNDQVAIEVYRIAQEAVNNAVKHAKAKHIRVTIEGTNDRTTLDVCDDGIGIGTGSKEQLGSGLRIMQHRARAIGGSLLIQQRPGGGTSVTCVLSKE